MPVTEASLVPLTGN